MQDSVSKTPSPKKKIVRRAWFWILIAVVLVVVLLFSMLPFGIDYGIEAYLKNQGADQVKVEDVDFNPLTGRMSLENLSVVIDSQTVLNIPEAMLDLEWGPFIKKRFVLKRVTISDTELTIKDLGEGRWQVGGINLQDKSETAEPSPWNFGLQQVTIKNSTIILISPQLSSDLKIEQATISKLSSWLPEQSARLEFKGQLNDGSLQLQVDVTPFANQIGTVGQIQLKGLTLVPFARLLEPHLKSLKGRLDADLDFETGQTAEEKLKIDADGKLKGSNLSTIIENANIQIQQDSIDWQGKIDYAQSAAAANLNLSGALSVQNTNVTGPEINLSEELLNWRGVFTFLTSNSNVTQNISLEGELSTGPLALRLPQRELNIEHTGLEWQGKFAYAQDKAKKSINADGQIHFDAAKLKSPELNLAEDKLSWQGGFQFFAAEESTGQRIKTDGTLDSRHLQVDLPDRKLKYDPRGLSWKGRLDTGETNDLSALKTEGNLTLKDVQILQSETNQRLLDTNQFDLQAVKIDGLNSVTVSGVVLSGLTLLAERESAPSPEAESTPLRIQDVKFENARLSQQKNLAIDAVRLTGLKGFLHRDRKGKWPAIERLASIRSDASSSDQTQRATSDSQVNEKSEKLDVRIGQIDIAGDSDLQFKDESIRPAFGMMVAILEARLANLDSSRPQQPASVKLLLSDKEDARLSLDGSLQPFGETLSLDWVGKIEALELPSLSAYVIQNTGFRFVSGELQADMPLKIDQNQLDGNIDLILFNPEVERAKAEASPEANQEKINISIPLDSALKLLRDKQNDVKLKIPIRGDVNDPKFSIADAINQVLVKALQKGVLSYLKFALGPYGIGLTVAEQVITGTAKIRLNPILFAPGSAELDNAAIDYTQRVATIMQEYPEVQVSVCGVATESDRAAVNGSPAAQSNVQPDNPNAALLSLAEQRSDQVKNQLVQSHGIAAKRIIECQPEVDKKADAKPRVDLDI